MELNSVRMNQRRVAMVKYFGELYNYRLLESADIFRVSYSYFFINLFNLHLTNSPYPSQNCVKISIYAFKLFITFEFQPMLYVSNCKSGVLVEHLSVI